MIAGKKEPRLGWGSTVVVLAGILILAAALRLVSLGEVPPGFFVDEASVGVNARLLGEAGIDQYGERFPIFFRALDDWKCGLFLYSMAPLLALVEPSEAIVRLPAALWGLLGIVVAFFLARELYGSESHGRWAALFLALTPWHIHYSRIAWQAFTLTIVYPAAMLFLARWFRTRRNADALLAGLLCGLTLYTYTVAKLLIALTLIGVAIGLVRIKARIGDRDLWIFAGVLVLVAAPYTVAYLSDYAAINHRLNLLLLPAAEVPQAYVSYLLPDFLWISGDGNLRHTPGQGLLSWYLAPLLLIGLFELARRKGRPRWWLLGALFCMPLMGSLSADYPQASRTIGMLPFVQILAAGGLIALGQQLQRHGRHRAWHYSQAALGVALAVTLGFFVHSYWGDYTERSRDAWYDGLLPAMRAAALARQPGELVRTRPNHAHYAHWMLVTHPPAERILQHREQLRAGAERYDPLDLANKYRFLDFMVVEPERGDPRSLPGIWVFSKKGLDLRRLKEQERRGMVELLYENDAYVVLRSFSTARSPSG